MHEKAIYIMCYNSAEKKKVLMKLDNDNDMEREVQLLECL